MFEDAQLINRLKKGDSQALCRIYRKYGDSLLAMAVGICRDRSIAEDALHDVFLDFVKNIDDFTLTGKLKSYLAKCVSNRVIDLLRTRSKHNEELSNIKPTLSSETVPHNKADKQEELLKLNEALDKLPLEQRQVIMMHIHGQMGYRQIANSQGVSINTIQGRYRYGIKKLKSLLIG